jgi:hypothetical protein
MHEASLVRAHGFLSGSLRNFLHRQSVKYDLNRRFRKDAQVRATLGLASTEASCTSSSLHSADLRLALKRFCATAEDRIVIPGAHSELVLAVAEVLEDQRHHPDINFSLRVTYGDIGWRPTDLTLSSALNRLMKAPQANQRVRLFAETHAMAEVMRVATNSSVKVVPHTTPLLQSYRKLFRPTTDRFIVIVPGKMRTEKGEHELDSVVEALIAQSPALASRTTFRLQKPMARRGPVSFDCLGEHLSPEAYARALATSDAALLLHDPIVFSTRGSGVVCDSIAARLPFVCRAGSSLAEWITDGNGIAEDSPSSIATALVTIANNLDDFRAQSDRAAARLSAALSPPILGVDDD